MREAEEVEGLRLPLAPRRAPLGRVAAKLDQAGLVGVQRQAELRQPLSQITAPLGLKIVGWSATAVMAAAALAMFLL